MYQQESRHFHISDMGLICDLMFVDADGGNVITNLYLVHIQRIHELPAPVL